MGSVEYDERRHDGGFGVDDIPRIEVEEISLEQWAQEQHDLVDRFVKHWTTLMRANPEDYPPQSWEGEWDEQFDYFVENTL